jgi:hypothetical protein
MRTLRGRLLAAFTFVLFVGLLVGVSRTSRALTVEQECAVCKERGDNCVVDTDASGNRVFRGCCSGTVCQGLNGIVAACCNNRNLGVCDRIAAQCVAQCSPNTNFCPHRKTCEPACASGKTFDPVSCECVAPCSGGRAQCGAGCCPEGHSCAVPQTDEQNMKCCPPQKGALRRFSGACGEFCRIELRKNRGGFKCCSGGPAFDPKTGEHILRWFFAGEACCGGEVIDLQKEVCCGGARCARGINSCQNGVCVPRAIDNRPHR